MMTNRRDFILSQIRRARTTFTLRGATTRPLQLVTCCLSILLLNMLPACGNHSDTVVSIALHPTKANIVYLATDEAVYKSRDTGQSWQRFQGELTRTRVISLAIDPELPANIFAGTNGDGTYKSPDGGRSWHQFNKGLHKGTISAIVNQVVFHPHNSQTLYAATTVGVFQSTDGGRTWAERISGMTEINFVVSLAIDPMEPKTMYAGTTGGVYRTKNGAENWVKVTEGMVAFDAKMASMAMGVNSLAIDPSQTNIVYAGTTQGLFKSTNRGNNWTKFGTALGESYVSAIQLDPSNTQIIYLATSEGVKKSTDGGKQWKLKSEGLEATSIRSIQLHPQDVNTLYIGTNGGGLYRSIDAGNTWSHLPLTPATT
ncbi:MAG: WD40/YVTN/BNR-like repeat-containing protein [Nitrospirales bacterium]